MPEHHKPRWRTRRLLTIAGGLVGVVLIASAVLFEPLHHAYQRHESCERTEAAQAAEAARNAPSPELVVFGDSYVAAFGATSVENGFAYDLGRELNYSTAADGVGGSGFVNPGSCGGSAYPTRLAALIRQSQRAKLIVIEGGLDDQTEPAARVRHDATHFLRQLVRSRADARVVLFGPVAPTATQTAGLVSVRRAYRSAARAAHVMFVDPIQQHWLTNANRARYIGSDQIHPTDAGHAYLARKLALALRR